MIQICPDVSTLNGCSCVRCGATNLCFEAQPRRLQQIGNSPISRSDADGTFHNDPEIRYGVIRCGACGASYDMIWGAPFLGAFEQQDVIGLIEIAANARADNTYASAADIRRLDDLLSRYHSAEDRDKFVREEPDPWVRAGWFQNRYSEWSHFELLSEGFSFTGLKVLDVGAGTGVDASRLVTAGAQVTALEYNPMLVRRGMGVVPEARWIGGFSHCLPFSAGTFDAVCCNAALHHMRDVSIALEEMLRVLKPGGWLFTTGDPYRARNTSADTEFEVFNRHEGVLLGINESIPPFSAFENVFLKYRHALDVKLLTGVLYDARLAGGQRVNISELRWWDFDKDREMLGNASGNLGVRCRLNHDITIPHRLQSATILSAGNYAACLTDYAASLQKLAPHVPDDLLDLPFPGRKQTKWELLNGWQAPEGGASRTAYKRARWFLRRPQGATELSFDARPRQLSDGSVVQLTVLLNGELVIERNLIPSKWNSLVIPLTSVPTGKTFICEIQLHLDSLAEPTFEACTFRVRRRRFDGHAHPLKRMFRSWRQARN
jgi:SAM-dependent methyltransferase